MRYTNTLLVSLTAMMITACSLAGDRVRTYDGPQRAQKEISILDCDQGGWATDFIVHRIDGKMGPKKPLFNADEGSYFGVSPVLELEPGPHVIEVLVMIGSAGGRAIVEHEFAPGKQYVMRVGVDMPASTRVAAVVGLPYTTPMRVWVEELQ